MKPHNARYATGDNWGFAHCADNAIVVSRPLLVDHLAMLTFQIRHLGVDFPHLQPLMTAMRLPRQLEVGCSVREAQALLQRWAPSVQVRFTEQVHGAGTVITRPAENRQPASVTFALAGSTDEARLGLLLYALGAQTVLQTTQDEEGMGPLRAAMSRLMSAGDDASLQWIKPAGWFCALIWCGLLGFNPQLVLAELLLLATEKRQGGALVRIIAEVYPDWADGSVWRDVLQSAMTHSAFVDAEETERHRMIAAAAADLAQVLAAATTDTGS